MAFVPIRGLSALTGLEKAAKLAREAIGRTPGVGVELPSDALEKLKWLAHGGRDFREVNATLKREMQGAFTAALRKVLAGKAGVSAPWKAAGEAYRDRLATRLATSGGDVKSHMKKLRPSTIERKGHARIGVDTGTLLRQVATAKVRTTKG
jgi:hypothetical protein